MGEVTESRTGLSRKRQLAVGPENEGAVASKDQRPVGRGKRGALAEVNANSKRVSREKEVQGGSQQSADKVRGQGSATLKKRKVYRDGEDDAAESAASALSPYTGANVRIAVRPNPAWNKPKHTWEYLDSLEKNDPSMVPEYSDDIFTYLFQREVETTPSHNYILDAASPNHIRNSVRAILVDWLIEVHHKFQCFHETLFLAINLMDRFLADNAVATNKLQLLAVTALFIAAKFEEIHLPKLEEYAYITDGAATKQDIKTAELYMLTKLEFNVGWPNPLYFLRRLSKADDYCGENRSVAKFFLEYAMASAIFLDKSASYTSAIAMYLARAVGKTAQTDLWNDNFYHYSGSIDPDTTPNFKADCRALIQEIANPKLRLPALNAKYGGDAADTVRYIAWEWCTRECNESFASPIQL